MGQSGHCLCGTIRYEIEGELGVLVNCHCQFCRRAHGSAFSTVSMIPRSAFHWLDGEDVAQEFETSGIGSRVFCGRCGTRLFNRGADHPEFVMIVVASLDVDPSARPSLHVNVESKAAWYEILDDQPQYVGLPPGVEAALEEDREAGA